MFLRFTTLQQDDCSHSLTGVFQAAYRLHASDRLAGYEERQLNSTFDWFNKHLRVPGCLHERENFRAVCWFQSSARKPLSHIWEIVVILREHGVFVRLHKAVDPGIVIYEDQWQVVAKPRRRRRHRGNQSTAAT